MIFSQFTYFLLLVVTLILFYSLEKHRKMVLFLSGLIFYISFATIYPAALIVLWLSLFIYLSMKERSKKIYFIGSVAVTVLVLLLFKLKTQISSFAPISAESIIMPLGISYLVFELISCRIDYAKNKISNIDFISFMSYVWFFPTRISGPIRRYDAFIKEVEQTSFSIENIYSGIIRILFGFAKKYVLVYWLSLVVKELASYNSIGLFPLLAYSFYIYFDFSAYSDIAIGSARLFGIKVPENFNHPYLKGNIRDFWNSWHMSLTTWLRDYIFMIVGKGLFKTFFKKSATAIAVISYLITFLICGLWHGGEAHFVVWGLYNGVLLSIHHIYISHMPRKILKSKIYNSILMKPFFIGLNFGLITLGWVFFAYDLPKVVMIFKFYI